MNPICRMWLAAMIVAFLLCAGCLAPSRVPGTDTTTSVTTPVTPALVSDTVGSDDRNSSDTAEQIKNDIKASYLSQKKYIPTKDINKHFLTIAFSEYNGVIMRREYRHSITISLFGAYSAEDKKEVEEFITKFNRISKTQKLYPFLKNDGNDADLWINIFPNRQLHDLQKDQIGNDQMYYTEYDSLFSDTIIYSVNGTEQIFVNADLPPEKRRHYLIRALTYWLGITGEALDEDSFFHPANTDKPDLAEQDWKAIMILYGPVVKYNMTMSDVKNRLYLGSS